MKNLKIYFGLFCIGLFSQPESHAQIAISISQPQNLQLRVSDVFSADLINTSGQQQTVFLLGTIRSIKSGLKIAEGRTQPIELPAGAKHVTDLSVSPVYTYYLASAEQTGFLPYGSYQFCLEAYATGVIEAKGNDCKDVEVTPLSPPLLLSPDNGALVQTNYPLLIWLPPTPMGQRSTVLYDLKLVEVLNSQTPYDAVQRNFAVFENQNLRSTNLQYPANALPLEDGKTYAWKIIAKTAEGDLIGETEVWSFKYGKTQTTVEVAPDRDYVELINPTLSNSYVEASKELRFTYKEEYKSGALTFKVTEMLNNRELKVSDEFLKVTGDNRYALRFDSRFRKDTFYILEVSNAKKEKRYLIFKIR